MEYIIDKERENVNFHVNRLKRKEEKPSYISRLSHNHFLISTARQCNKLVCE